MKIWDFNAKQHNVDSQDEEKIDLNMKMKLTVSQTTPNINFYTPKWI